MPVSRPPRTDAHHERDRLLAQFAALGLQAVVSTNGSIPDADIQISYDKTTRPGGDVVRCDLTDAGAARLKAAESTREAPGL